MFGISLQRENAPTSSDSGIETPANSSIDTFRKMYSAIQDRLELESPLPSQLHINTVTSATGGVMIHLSHRGKPYEYKFLGAEQVLAGVAASYSTHDGLIWPILVPINSLVCYAVSPHTLRLLKTGALDQIPLSARSSLEQMLDNVMASKEAERRVRVTMSSSM